MEAALKMEALLNKYKNNSVFSIIENIKRNGKNLEFDKLSTWPNHVARTIKMINKDMLKLKNEFLFEKSELNTIIKFFGFESTYYFEPFSDSEYEYDSDSD